MRPLLREYVPGAIWLCRYGVRYFGCALEARMTVIRLADGRLILHSPCEITEKLKQEIAALGPVVAILAPGNFHYLHVPSAQAAFPAAKTYICPGVEKKMPQMNYDAELGDVVPPDWADDLDQVLVHGSRWMREVAFFHKASKTLILVDLIENITDATPRTNWGLKFWWKIVFHMWNRPLPAPEYRLGWRDKAAARTSLERILEWDFLRVILAHGDLIDADAKRVVRKAWQAVLGK